MVKGHKEDITNNIDKLTNEQKKNPAKYSVQ